MAVKPGFELIALLLNNLACVLLLSTSYKKTFLRCLFFKGATSRFVHLFKKICLNFSRKKIRRKDYGNSYRVVISKRIPSQKSTQQSFLRGCPAPRSKPLPLLYTTFNQKGNPLSYTSIENGIPLRRGYT